MDNTEPSRLARAALTQICEPTDHLASALICSFGPEHALQVMTHDHLSAPEHAAASQCAQEAGFTHPRKALEKGRERWRHRWEKAHPQDALRFASRIGAGLLIPEDPQWPENLNHLGPESPYALWIRGTAGEGSGQGAEQSLPLQELLARLPVFQHSCAVVGSRASTSYGQMVTHEIVRLLRTRGITIVSGGAFGIDQQAHSSALSAEDAAAPESGEDPEGGCVQAPSTVAVLACGVDRFYPASHESLLRRIMCDGLVLSELPPGASPTRWRFLQRNRLIAALSQAVIVPEAGERSGALSTANHAGELGREIGAVPGAVTSSASRGCHRLIREGKAHLIAAPEDALELMGLGQEPSPVEQRRITDGMNQRQQIVFEATPLGTAATAESIARTAGCTPTEAEAELALFELAALVERSPSGRWKRQHC